MWIVCLDVYVFTCIYMYVCIDVYMYASLDMDICWYDVDVSVSMSVVSVDIPMKARVIHDLFEYHNSSFHFLSHSRSFPLFLFLFSPFSGQRVGAFKQPFTHWLPLYISSYHFQRAGKLVEEALIEICTNLPLPHSHNFSSLPKSKKCAPFHESYAVEVLSTLMNSMIVSLSSGSQHCSISFLQVLYPSK